MENLAPPQKKKKFSHVLRNIKANGKFNQPIT